MLPSTFGRLRPRDYSPSANFNQYCADPNKSQDVNGCGDYRHGLILLNHNSLSGCSPKTIEINIHFNCACSKQGDDHQGKEHLPRIVKKFGFCLKPKHVVLRCSHQLDSWRAGFIQISRIPAFANSLTPSSVRTTPFFADFLIICAIRLATRAASFASLYSL